MGKKMSVSLLASGDCIDLLKSGFFGTTCLCRQIHIYKLMFFFSLLSLKLKYKLHEIFRNNKAVLNLVVPL